MALSSSLKCATHIDIKEHNDELTWMCLRHIESLLGRVYEHMTYEYYIHSSYNCMILIGWKDNFTRINNV